ADEPLFARLRVQNNDIAEQESLKSVAEFVSVINLQCYVYQNSQRMKNRVRNLSQIDSQFGPAPFIDHSFQPQSQSVAIEVDISFEGMVIISHAEHRLLDVRPFDRT